MHHQIRQQHEQLLSGVLKGHGINVTPGNGGMPQVAVPGPGSLGGQMMSIQEAERQDREFKSRWLADLDKRHGTLILEGANNEAENHAFELWKSQLNNTTPVNHTIREGRPGASWRQVLPIDQQRNIQLDAVVQVDMGYTKVEGAAHNNLAHQVFLLTQRSDPKGLAKAAQTAKAEAQEAAKASQVACKQATQAASDAATVAATEAATATKKHTATLVATAETAAKECEVAYERAQKAAALAAEVATKEAAISVAREAKSSLLSAEKAAEQSKVASERAIACAESSEATPLMAEIGKLRTAQQELDSYLAKAQDLEVRLSRVESNFCNQFCSVM
jgi:hypothetical protein